MSYGGAHSHQTTRFCGVGESVSIFARFILEFADYPVNGAVKATPLSGHHDQPKSSPRLTPEPGQSAAVLGRISARFRPVYPPTEKSIIMFGISTLGWLHTLGSLPAIPAAAYMFARHGRIVPRSVPGAVYFIAMVIGGATVFLITAQPVGYVIGAITLLLLFAGYGVGRLRGLGRAGVYIETICLSLTAFLLMLPTLTETLRRVPDGHPLVTDLNSPVLLASQASLLLALLIGLTAQILYLRKQPAISLP
jgi:hypothetical protein